MRHRRWTEDDLRAAVASSLSIAEVLRKLNLRVAGGSYTNIQVWMLKWGLDTSHFLGKAANHGPRHRGGKKPMTPDETLVLGTPGFHTAARSLRRALVLIGVPEQCDVCGGGPVWQGRPMKLQIDHRNGKRWDNRRENIRFICPNCHSQTETFGSKNKATLTQDGEKEFASIYDKTQPSSSQDEAAVA